MVLTLIGCFGGSKDDYKDYIGYEFSGNDPWGNIFSVNLKSLNDDKLVWTFNDVIGESDLSTTISNEFTNEIKDDVVEFHVSGTALDNSNVSYDYSGTLTLKDKKVVVKFEKGHVSEASENGGSQSYQVEGLDSSKKSVTLTKNDAK